MEVAPQLSSASGSGQAAPAGGGRWRRYPRRVFAAAAPVLVFQLASTGGGRGLWPKEEVDAEQLRVLQQRAPRSTLTCLECCASAVGRTAAEMAACCRTEEASSLLSGARWLAKGL